MEYISIIDYIGNCDEKGNATGHVLKTLTEAIELIKDSFKVNLIITEDYNKYFLNYNIKYNLKLSSKINFKKGILSKIFFQIQKVYYTNYVLRKERMMWFINSDFWLFFSLILFRKKKGQKIYITNYIDYQSEDTLVNRMKKIVFNKAIKKVDCVFTTNSELKLEKHMYIPDYIFDENLYIKYKTCNKKRIVYMCGGMNKAKDIEGLVEAFNENGEELVIKGKFSDEKYFLELSNKLKSNIKIYNEILDYNEYYDNISKSLFIILPYKKENYNNRSSGIILESIFLDSIVIGPDFLLKQLNISGISYKDISELKNLNLSNISKESICDIREKNKSIISKYNIETIRNKLINEFRKS